LLINGDGPAAGGAEVDADEQFHGVCPLRQFD
jgi:hypothetical protein